MITIRNTPLEIVFQEQSYSSLNSGQSLAWDHFNGDIADPCGGFANPGGVISDPSGISIPEAIGCSAVGDAAIGYGTGADADRCETR